MSRSYAARFLMMVAKRGGERSAVYDPKKVEGAPGRRPLAQ